MHPALLLISSLAAGLCAAPDIVGGDISVGAAFGAVADVNAFALGSAPCNIGDADLLCSAATNQHYLLTHNIYRISNNRMELIGQSWVFHGYFALAQPACGTCNGHGGSVLGAGCSDPHSAVAEADQLSLGPRSHVNAATGYFPFPISAAPPPYVIPPPAAPTIGRRIQINRADIAPPPARYVAELHTIAPDDSAALRGSNNASYRLIDLTAGSILMQGGTVRTLPALYAWQSLDPSVVVQRYDIPEGPIDTHFYAAAKSVDNGDGTWTYNYIILNLNSDRSASAFSVPAPNVVASNFYQRMPLYHSGEPASMNNPWIRTVDSATVTWTTPDAYSAASPWGSALRWATAATFSFTADSPPIDGTCSLAFFKPGAASTLALPGLPVPTPRPCPADFNHDNTVDLFDYLDFLSAFSTRLPSSDFNHDGVIDLFDYLDFLAAFSRHC